MKLPRIRDARGLTLTELTIVMALAALVITGLTGFYFASQTTWLNGSTKAMAQRDATMLTEDLGTWLHRAASVTVDAGNGQFNTLHLYDAGLNEFHTYQWQVADSLLYGGAPGALLPIANSKVTRFQVTSIGDSLVQLTSLQVKSADGDVVDVASMYALYARP
jgi:hypothetical protein